MAWVGRKQSGRVGVSSGDKQAFVDGNCRRWATMLIYPIENKLI